jgi:hypothetical protein
MSKKLEIIHTSDHDLCVRLRDAGYEPVECCFGSKSVLGPLYMDHHGPESGRAGVAIRAYRDHFGARCDDPRFCATGGADADMCFAIAALAGILPHPSRSSEFANASESVRALMTRDLNPFADLINLMDTAPIGVRLEEKPDGNILLLWDQLASSAHDASAVHAGVDRWRRFFSDERPLTSLYAAAAEQEASRVSAARLAKVETVSPTVALVVSAVRGFDVWYAEVAPVIVLLKPEGVVSIGCPNKAVAEELFGVGGLMNVFPHLLPAGWGGRESIGGSPRGLTLSFDQALTAAQMVATFVKATG